MNSFGNKFNAGAVLALTALHYIGETASGWHKVRISNGEVDFDANVPPDEYEALEIDDNDVILNGRLVGERQDVLQASDRDRSIMDATSGPNGTNAKPAKK